MFCWGSCAQILPCESVGFKCLLEILLGELFLHCVRTIFPSEMLAAQFEVLEVLLGKLCESVGLSVCWKFCWVSCACIVCEYHLTLRCVCCTGLVCLPIGQFEVLEVLLGKLCGWFEVLVGSSVPLYVWVHR